ncbi:MAG: hypothetical protein QOE54_915, partial [Streptosporangiaceae bacterium]|nr:hypothetical protein [Streptosporangiaceae bacterium]
MKDPNNTRDTLPRRGSPLWVYIVCVTVVGAVVVGATAAGLSMDDVQTTVRSPLFWLLGCLIVVGELRPIITPGLNENNGATASTTFAFAALLYGGLPVAAALQTVAVLVCGVLRRRAPHRNVFNAAQFMVSMGAASLVLAAFGKTGSAAHPWVPHGTDLPIIALAGATYFLMNDTMV